MKATLEFDLTDADERMAHLQCVHASSMAIILWDLVYNTRKQMERLLEENPDYSTRDIIDQYHQRIIESLDEHGIDIDSINR